MTGCGLSTLVFALGLAFGSSTTILSKVLYTVSSPGVDGEHRLFEKPLFLTLIMFIGMSFAMPLHFLDIARKRRDNQIRVAPPIPWSSYLALAIPSVFDLLATALSQAGLIFVPVSTFQLMRCTVIIVTALMKIFFMKQRLASFSWIGIGMNAFAMLLVSIASFDDPTPETDVNGHNSSLGGSQLGIFLILMSCIVSASQYVYEELLMKGEADVPPLLVVCFVVVVVVFHVSLSRFSISDWHGGHLGNTDHGASGVTMGHATSWR